MAYEWLTKWDDPLSFWSWSMDSWSMNPKIEETSMVKDNKSNVSRNMFAHFGTHVYLQKNTVWNHQIKVIFQILENDISEQSGDTSEQRYLSRKSLPSFLPQRVLVVPKNESWISGWLKNQESHSMSELLHVDRLEKFRVFRSTNQE